MPRVSTNDFRGCGMSAMTITFTPPHRTDASDVFSSSCCATSLAYAASVARCAAAICSRCASVRFSAGVCNATKYAGAASSSFASGELAAEMRNRPMLCEACGESCRNTIVSVASLPAASGSANRNRAECSRSIGLPADTAQPLPALPSNAFPMLNPPCSKVATPAAIFTGEGFSLPGRCTLTSISVSTKLPLSDRPSPPCVWLSCRSASRRNAVTASMSS